MSRRLAAVLIGAAMLVAGVVARPCITQACTLALVKQMACCNDAVRSGISTPNCCSGKQLQHPAAAPAADPSARTVFAVAQQVVPLTVTAVALPVLPLLAHDVAPGAGPPGGPLTAQHTSLLL